MWITRWCEINCRQPTSRSIRAAGRAGRPLLGGRLENSACWIPERRVPVRRGTRQRRDTLRLSHYSSQARAGSGECQGATSIRGRAPARKEDAVRA